MSARYRPPALRALAGSSPPNDIATPPDAPPSNYPPGFRRARAGTLPSNVQLAAQRFAAASTTLGSTPPSTESLLEQSQRSLAPAASAALATSSRPAVRHSNTSTTAPSVPERNSRLRSGSLTLPSAGLPNTFGSSIFSSPWLPSNNGTANGFPVLEELRSVTSADSVGDDFEHTLNYLGLNDHDPPPAATISELRNQAQAAIAGNLAGSHARLRASTVSNPYRTRSTTSLLSTPAAEGEDEYFDGYDDQIYTRQHINAYDPIAQESTYNTSSLMTKGFKQADHLSIPTRPRAISVGILDDPMRTLQRRTTGADAHSYISDLSTQGATLSTPTPPGILKVDKTPSVRTASSSNVHFPSADMPIGRGASAYLVAPASQNRSVSPKSEIPVSQVQTPTRSLWIGNLDSAVTRDQLIHVFAPYGAIESLRLLPEKVSSSCLIIIMYLRGHTGMRVCQLRRTG